MWKNVYLIRITNEAYKDLHSLSCLVLDKTKNTFLVFLVF